MAATALTSASVDRLTQKPANQQEPNRIWGNSKKMKKKCILGNKDCKDCTAETAASSPVPTQHVPAAVKLTDLPDAPLDELCGPMNRPAKHESRVIEHKNRASTLDNNFHREVSKWLIDISALITFPDDIINFPAQQSRRWAHDVMHGLFLEGDDTAVALSRSPLSGILRRSFLSTLLNDLWNRISPGAWNGKLPGFNEVDGKNPIRQGNSFQSDFSGCLILEFVRSLISSSRSASEKEHVVAASVFCRYIYALSHITKPDYGRSRSNSSRRDLDKEIVLFGGELARCVMTAPAMHSLAGPWRVLVLNLLFRNSSSTKLSRAIQAEQEFIITLISSPRNNYSSTAGPGPIVEPSAKNSIANSNENTRQPNFAVGLPIKESAAHNSVDKSVKLPQNVNSNEPQRLLSDAVRASYIKASRTATVCEETSGDSSVNEAFYPANRNDSFPEFLRQLKFQNPQRDAKVICDTRERISDQNGREDTHPNGRSTTNPQSGSDKPVTFMDSFQCSAVGRKEDAQVLFEKALSQVPPKSLSEVAPKSPSHVAPNSPSQVAPKSPSHVAPKSPSHVAPKTINANAQESFDENCGFLSVNSGSDGLPDVVRDIIDSLEIFGDAHKAPCSGSGDQEADVPPSLLSNEVISLTDSQPRTICSNKELETYQDNGVPSHQPCQAQRRSPSHFIRSNDCASCENQVQWIPERDSPVLRPKTPEFEPVWESRLLPLLGKPLNESIDNADRNEKEQPDVRFVSPALTALCEEESGIFNTAAYARQLLFPSSKRRRSPESAPEKWGDRIETGSLKGGSTLSRASTPLLSPSYGLLGSRGRTPGSSQQQDVDQESCTELWLTRLVRVIDTSNAHEVSKVFDLMIKLHRPANLFNQAAEDELTQMRFSQIRELLLSQCAPSTASTKILIDRQDWLDSRTTNKVSAFQQLIRSHKLHNNDLDEFHNFTQRAKLEEPDRLLDEIFLVGLQELLYLAASNDDIAVAKRIFNQITTIGPLDPRSMTELMAALYRKTSSVIEVVSLFAEARFSSSASAAKTAEIFLSSNESAALSFLRASAADQRISPAVLSQLTQRLLRMEVLSKVILPLIDMLITSPLALPLRDTAVRHRIGMNASLFGAVTDYLIRSKKEDKLSQLVNAYRSDAAWQAAFVPDAQTSSMLIKALGIAGRVDDCKWLFQHLSEQQQTGDLSEVTHGCMLDALVNNGRVSEAVHLFHRVKASGRIKPNTIMYSTLVKGFAQDRQLDQALELHREMQETGVPINTVTYNSLVDACARVGAMDKAAALLGEMLKSGVEPDLITFSTVAKGYCVQGNIARAMQLFDAMRTRGIAPDGILYNSLLDGCVRAGRLDLCEDLWAQMQAANIRPSNFTLTILIKLFGRAGKLDRAFEAVRQLPRRYKFAVNAHVYTCLMSACIANRRFDKALDVFRCMTVDRIATDAKSFETALFGATRAKDYDYALQVIRFAFNVRLPGNVDASLPSVPMTNSRRSAGRSPGFDMESRNFRNLWNAMREDGALSLRGSYNVHCGTESPCMHAFTQMANPTLDLLERTYGRAVYRYFPSPSPARGLFWRGSPEGQRDSFSTRVSRESGPTKTRDNKNSTRLPVVPSNREASPPSASSAATKSTATTPQRGSKDTLPADEVATGPEITSLAPT